MHNDTIAAVATAAGRGGIGIVRLSGPQALNIAQQITGTELVHRHAAVTHFKDHEGVVLDQGVALYFEGPESFTGEDVVELQAHGSPVVLDLLLNTANQLGARLARPGEFSERAFLNDKIDLVQAEAIADLIESSSERGARSAMRSLQGAFSSQIDAISAEIIELRLFVEAAIDFPDEDIDFLADGQIQQRTEELASRLIALKQLAGQGVVLRDGINVVICGKPNAGKSTLLNQLAQQDIAIVTEEAGTTRDTLKHELVLDGIPLHIVDTAGIRDSDNVIEREGIRRAIEQIAQADIVLLVNDASSHFPNEDNPRDVLNQYIALAGIEQAPAADVPIIVVNNKIDLIDLDAARKTASHAIEIFISARRGDGLELLTESLKACCGMSENNENSVVARRRHLSAINGALSHLQYGLEKLRAEAPELLAEDLRQAHDQLGEITGKMAPDELLGKIFSSFCIGK